MHLLLAASCSYLETKKFEVSRKFKAIGHTRATEASNHAQARLPEPKAASPERRTRCAGRDRRTLSGGNPRFDGAIVEESAGHCRSGRLTPRGEPKATAKARLELVAGDWQRGDLEWVVREFERFQWMLSEFSGLQQVKGLSGLGRCLPALRELFTLHSTERYRLPKHPCKPRSIGNQPMSACFCFHLQTNRRIPTKRHIAGKVLGCFPSLRPHQPLQLPQRLPSGELICGY